MLKIIHLYIKNKKIFFLPKNDCIFLLILLLFVTFVSYILHNDVISWISSTLTLFNMIFNDSIQSLGMFLYLEKKKNNFLKILLFLFCTLFITIFLGWKKTNSIHFHKLDKIPYTIEYKYINLLSPIILILMTYNKLPISTTFLILSTFSSLYIIKFILVKALLGYIIGFVSIFIIYMILLKIFDLKFFKKKSKLWNIIKWITTGFLWQFWFIQNIGVPAIFIPRLLSFTDLILFLIILLIILIFYLYKDGAIVKNVIISKTEINDSKSVSIINLLFSFDIFLISKIKFISNIPFITTFMFIGILTGREIAIFKHNNVNFKKIKKNMIKDFISAIFGVMISLIFILFNVFLKKIKNYVFA